MTANEIRNICLLGHGGSGKTTLAEQMLFMTKGTDRFGKTVDGNTTCDYDVLFRSRAASKITSSASCFALKLGLSFAFWKASYTGLSR